MTIQSELAQANLNRNGPIYPGHVTRSETVTDDELRELLEYFITSVNTQNPDVNREPQLELRANAPEELRANAPEQMRSVPVHHQGISRNKTAMIISLAIAAGIGWLLLTNPGFLDGEIKLSAQQSAFIKAALTK